MRYLVARLVCSTAMALLCGATLAHGKPDSGSDAFVTWAKAALVPLPIVPPAAAGWSDLQPLGEMIGAASVVALSEGVHAGAEPLEMRNRLFQYLVQEKGFTAIAIESGIVEGKVVHDYVRGGAGELSTVLHQGVSWTFDHLPQNQELIRWLREYNANPRIVRKVNFYGFDVPGSPGNAQAKRGTETALTEALKYLATVDPTAATGFRARLDTLLPRVHFDRKQTNGLGYQSLSGAERDTITAVINDLITLLERKEALYSAVGSTNDYEWAYRAAIGARQVDGWLRQMPVGAASGDYSSYRTTAIDVRDRGQADNLGWIIQREGPQGKVLVFAARYHLSSVPIESANWMRPGATSVQQVAGTYLRRRLGDRLFTIGNLIGKGAVGCAGFNMQVASAPSGSIEGLAGRFGIPWFLLDVRKAPAAVSDWLGQEQQLGGDDFPLLLPMNHAYDVLLYVDNVKPACP